MKKSIEQKRTEAINEALRYIDMKAKAKKTKYLRGAAWHAAREGKKIVAEQKEPDIREEPIMLGRDTYAPLVWIAFYNLKEPGLYVMSTQDGVETVRAIKHSTGDKEYFTADTTIRPFTQIRNSVIIQATFQKIRE